MKMSDATEFLAEQKRLAEDATEGPWRSSRLFDGVEYEDGSSSYRGGVYSNRDGAAPVFITQSVDKRDLVFIASARSSVPKLVAALEAVGEIRSLVSRPGDAPHVLSTIAGYNRALTVVRATIEAALGGEDDGE